LQSSYNQLVVQVNCQLLSSDLSAMRDLRLFELLKSKQFAADELCGLLHQAQSMPLRNIAPLLGWLGPALQHTDSTVRAAAVGLLHGFSGLQTIRTVVRALRDEERCVREAAVDVLAGISQSDQVRITHALFHPRQDVRQLALRGLNQQQIAHYAIYLLADPANKALAIEKLQHGKVEVPLEAVLSFYENRRLTRDQAIRFVAKTSASVHYSMILESSRRTKSENNAILEIARTGADLPPSIAGINHGFAERLFRLMWELPAKDKSSHAESSHAESSHDDASKTVEAFWENLHRGSGKARKGAAVSALLTGLRENSWPLAAVKFLVQIWPTSLLFECIPLQLRQQAIYVLYQSRDAHKLNDALLLKVLDGPLCQRADGQINLRAAGAALHLCTSTTPYKWLLEWCKLSDIVQAFHREPVDSVAFLSHRDKSDKGRSYLIRKICAGSGRKNFRYAALVAATVSADSLDFLQGFTPAESVQVFACLRQISTQPGMKLNEKKLRFAGEMLGANICKGAIEQFYRVWLATDEPSCDALGQEIFTTVARTVPAGTFVATVCKMNAASLRKLLKAIAWCPGFPYGTESQLAASLTKHADSAIQTWAVDRAPSASRKAVAATGGDVTASKAVSVSQRNAIAAASASDLEALMAPFVAQPHTGFCTAVAGYSAGPVPSARVACALLGSADPVEDIDQQFQRVLILEPAMFERLDQLMVRHWVENNNISILGSAWLFRWQQHANRLADLIKSQGADAVLHLADSLTCGVLSSQCWQAVAKVFVNWRYQAPPAVDECFTMPVAELLVEGLTTANGAHAAKILSTVYCTSQANPQLAAVRKSVTQLLPELTPEVRFLLRDWVDSRGLKGVVAAAAKSKAPAELLTAIAASNDFEELQQWCRDSNSAIAQEAGLRLLELGGAGELCILAALMQPPLPAHYQVLAESVQLWGSRSADCALQQARQMVLLQSGTAALRFRLGLGLLLRDAADGRATCADLLQAVVEAACAPDEEPWLLQSDWGKLSGFIEPDVLARHWAVSPQPYAYQPALERLLRPGRELRETDFKANNFAVRNFLACGSERLEALRLSSALWLQKRGDNSGFTVILAGALAGDTRCLTLLSGLPGEYVEATAMCSLMAGQKVFPEKQLLEMLRPHDVDELSCDLALQMLLREGRDKTIREAVIKMASRPHVKSQKLRQVAQCFAWGVKVGRELTGKLFMVQMISGDDLGYTRLMEPKIYINPLPILRREPHSDDVVEGLILHELGHHMYHADKVGIEIFEQAGKERLHGLLNIVSDEHLERNIRAIDGGFGDKIKRLGAYAFQHSGKELEMAKLLQTLQGRAFDILTATPLRVARGSGCVKVDSGGLLFEMEKAGMSFARFFRALRMGLGDRHNDAKVRQGLALFKGKFRQNKMPALLDIARQLQQIFGDEAAIASSFSQDNILCPNDGELDEYAEGITSGELQSEIRRITDPRQLQNPESSNEGKDAGGARLLNVIADENFATINTVSPMPYDAPAHARLAMEVRRSANRLRGWLQHLGVAMVAERRRLSGKRLDTTRVRDLVLRKDPRILVSRRQVLQTDLFIGIAIDCSGSMTYAQNLEKAKRFASLIAEACRGMQGVDLRIFGFTDSVIYDCGDAVRPAVSGLEASGGNNDAAALWHAANVARASHRSARLLVMISDGLPTECSVDALRALVTQLTNRYKMCCAQVAVQPLEEICFPHYVCLAGESQENAIRRFGEIITRLVRRAMSS